MSVSLLRQNVNARFKDNWVATPAAEIDYGMNKRFTPKDETPWCRLAVNITSTVNAEVGTRIQRIRGFIVVQCFVPLLSGEFKVDEMLEDAKDVFENETFESIQCFETDYRSVGPSGNWFQKNALTRFKYDVFSL